MLIRLTKKTVIGVDVNDWFVKMWIICSLMACVAFLFFVESLRHSDLTMQYGALKWLCYSFGGFLGLWYYCEKKGSFKIIQE